MRCLACNRALDDFEATRKYKDEKLGYVQLCNDDFNHIKDLVNVTERRDLKDESYEDDDEITG